MLPPTDPDRPADPPAGGGGGRFGLLWRRTGWLYLLTSLAAFSLALWSEHTLPALNAGGGAPLATLGALAVGQVAFVLLVHPLVMLSRGEAGGGQLVVVAEAGLCLLMTVPFYVAAAFLADARAADVVRAAVYVACVWSIAWAAGAHLASGRPGRTVVVGMLLIIAIGLPAACYVAGDLLDSPAAQEWLWRLSPATFAWQVASCARAEDPASALIGAWVPRPLWALLCWPALAAAVRLAGVLATRPAGNE